MDWTRVGPKTRAGIWIVLAGCVFGVLAGCFALRGSAVTDIVDTDAARHAMNGALVYDLVHSGHWRHPVAYAEWYYSRLPATSMPYHPPLFPAFEALAFAFAGVNVLAARAAIALCVAIASTLLVLLVWSTHRSAPLAFGTTFLFLAAPLSSSVAGDVMLEFPAMVWTLLAIRLLAGATQRNSAQAAVAYGVCAALAIWTKHCVFLCVTPLLYGAMARNWGTFRKAAVWIATVIPSLAAILLATVSWNLGWSGLNQTWASRGALSQILYNATYYAGHLVASPAAWAVLLLLGGYVLLRSRARTDSSERELPYWAWLLSVLAVLLISPAYSLRYLFFAYPPAIVILLVTIEAMCARLPAIRRAATFVPLAIGVAGALFVMQTPARNLRGPGEAAIWVAERGLTRVIYCGITDGNFVFALRSVEQRPTTAVIRGEKLPRRLFHGTELVDFARTYGVEAIILERTSAPQMWDSLYDAIAPSREIVMTSSEAQLQGALRLLLVEGATRSPGRLPVPIDTLGRTVDLKSAP